MCKRFIKILCTIILFTALTETATADQFWNAYPDGNNRVLLPINQYYSIGARNLSGGTTGFVFATPTGTLTRDSTNVTLNFTTMFTNTTTFNGTVYFNNYTYFYQTAYFTNINVSNNTNTNNLTIYGNVTFPNLVDGGNRILVLDENGTMTIGNISAPSDHSGLTGLLGCLGNICYHLNNTTYEYLKGTDQYLNTTSPVTFYNLTLGYDGILNKNITMIDMSMPKIGTAGAATMQYGIKIEKSEDDPIGINRRKLRAIYIPILRQTGTNSMSYGETVGFKIENISSYSENGQQHQQKWTNAGYWVSNINGQNTSQYQYGFFAENITGGGFGDQHGLYINNVSGGDNNYGIRVLNVDKNYIDGYLVLEDGNIKMNTTTNEIETGTIDDSDNAVLKLTGAGAPTLTRGAVIQLYGNEHSTGAGDLYLASGESGIIDIRGNTSIDGYLDVAGMNDYLFFDLEVGTSSPFYVLKMQDYSSDISSLAMQDVSGDILLDLSVNSMQPDINTSNKGATIRIDQRDGSTSPLVQILTKQAGVSNSVAKIGINVDGDMGIGDLSPDAKFHVAIPGSTPTKPSGNWSAMVENLLDSAYYNGLMVATRWGNSQSKVFEAATYWNGFSEEYTPIMTITGLRNVGIGKEDPSSRLHVRYPGSLGTVEPTGVWATKIENLNDSTGHHGLTVATRWGAVDSKVLEAATYWNGTSQTYTPILTVTGDRNVGINEDVPKADLHVSSDGAEVHSSLIGGNDDIIYTGDSGSHGLVPISGGGTSDRGVLKFSKVSGNMISPSALTNGHLIGSIISAGYDGSALRSAGGFDFRVDGTVSSGNVPTAITMSTGTSSRIERFRINSSGDVRLTGKLGIGDHFEALGTGNVEIYGINNNREGSPGLSMRTSASIYPSYYSYTMNNDDVGIAFDAYYDRRVGYGWRSSNSAGNQMIQKWGGDLHFYVDDGVSPGNSITWNDAMYITEVGDVTIPINLYLNTIRKDSLATGSNIIQVSGATTDKDLWMRFRYGGGTPKGRSGTIYSSVDSTHYFFHNNAGDFEIVYSTEIGTTPDIDSGSASTSLVLDNGATLSLKKGPITTDIGTVSTGRIHNSFRTSAGVRRIGIGLIGTEGGSDTGSDYAIWRYNDAGSYLGNPFKIKRSDGYIGFGQSNPLSQLHQAVASHYHEYANALHISYGVHYDSGWKYTTSDSGTIVRIGYSGTFAVYTTPSGTAGGSVPVVNQRLNIDNSGTLYVPGAYASTSGNPANMVVDSVGKISRSVSSIIYKKNIRNIETDTSKIYSLNPRTFEMKFDNSTHSGLIAEEVYEIYPEAVVLDVEGNPENIDWNVIIVSMLAEIKDLRERVEVLE